MERNIVLGELHAVNNMVVICPSGNNIGANAASFPPTATPLYSIFGLERDWSPRSLYSAPRRRTGTAKPHEIQSGWSFPLRQIRPAAFCFLSKKRCFKRISSAYDTSSPLTRRPLILTRQRNSPGHFLTRNLLANDFVPSFSLIIFYRVKGVMLFL